MSKKRTQRGPAWLRELQRQFPGEYIAFLGSEVVGHSSDGEELRRRMARDFPGEPVVTVWPKRETLPLPKPRSRVIDMGDGKFRLMVR